METKNSEVVEIDIGELFLALLNKLWLVIIFGVLFAAGAGFASDYFLEPIYTSTTKVYVINRQEENKMTLSDLQTGTQLTKDYMILVKSRPVTEQVIEELDLDITHESLVSMIEVNNPMDTRILEITIHYPDAEMAKVLADTIAKVSAERMVKVMEMDKVNIMERGNIPTQPSSPSLYKNVILGGIFGVVLSSLIVILRHLTNDSIRNSEDIEKYLGLTTLSNIPMEEGSNGKEKKVKKSKIKQSKSKSALAS